MARLSFWYRRTSFMHFCTDSCRAWEANNRASEMSADSVQFLQMDYSPCRNTTSVKYSCTKSWCSFASLAFDCIWTTHGLPSVAWCKLMRVHCLHSDSACSRDANCSRSWLAEDVVAPIGAQGAAEINEVAPQSLPTKNHQRKSRRRRDPLLRRTRARVCAAWVRVGPVSAAATPRMRFVCVCAVRVLWPRGRATGPESERAPSRNALSPCTGPRCTHRRRCSPPNAHLRKSSVFQVGRARSVCHCHRVQLGHVHACMRARMHARLLATAGATALNQRIVCFKCGGHCHLHTTGIPHTPNHCIHCVPCTGTHAQCTRLV